jgi:Glycosyltransferase family 87
MAKRKRSAGAVVDRQNPTQKVPSVTRRWDPSTLCLLVILGLVARVLIALVSWGTGDVYTFYRFAVQVDHVGLLRAYQQDADLNHPPIPAYWAWAAYRLTRSEAVPVGTEGGGNIAAPQRPAETSTSSDEWFSFVLKLPVMLADCVTAWLLWRVWRLRGADAGGAAAAAAVFAWSLCSILVTGYHGNTDPIYGMLGLTCVYLLFERSSYLWAGVALAAAINIKLTPVLLIPPLLLACKSWRAGLVFVAGLSLGVIPFLPLIFTIGPRFYHNVLAYRSNLDRWGISLFLQLIDYRAAEFYYANARYAVLAAVIAWGVVARLRRRWSGYEIAAVALALSLVLTGGFGVQYTVIVLPLMIACRRGFSLLYGTVAGLFIGVVYAATLTKDYPFYSQSQGMFPWPTAVLGLGAWGLLVAFIALTIRRPQGSAAPAPAEGGRLAGT